MEVGLVGIFCKQTCMVFTRGFQKTTAFVLNNMSKREVTAAMHKEVGKKPKHWSFALVESMKNPKEIVKQTDRVVVIRDKYPKAKLHYLALPREEINAVYDLNNTHINLLEEFGRLFEEIKLDNKDHELKAGFHAVPSMKRLHMHIISQDMISPCLKTKVHWNTFTTKFFLPYQDVLKELREAGRVKKMSNEEHKSLMALPLKCNKCSYVAMNMPKLKEHLLTHQTA